MIRIIITKKIDSPCLVGFLKGITILLGGLYLDIRIQAIQAVTRYYGLVVAMTPGA